MLSPAPCARAQAGASPPAPAGCTLAKKIYTCNWTAFEQVFTAAHTVKIETQSLDRSTAAQLRQLATRLGKTVVSNGQPADLTFLLIPIGSDGLYVGPAAEQLATLRIYAPGTASSRGALLWAETYTGEPDRPWPVIAHALIAEFQARFPKQ